MGLGIWNSISGSVGAVKDKVSKTAQKSWGAVTGKTVANEAKEIYEEAKAKYDWAREEHKSFIEASMTAVENEIKNINGYKQGVYEVELARFVQVANKIKNVTVKGIPVEEIFDKSLFSFKADDSLRSREGVLLIDFDNLSFTDVALGVLTLGFSSRKQANKSKTRALEQAKAMEESIQKMDAGKRKIKVLRESLSKVVEYFDTLTCSYSKLLDRFEYGVNSQSLLNITRIHCQDDGKLDFKKLPIAHLEEFQALFNLSIVLKQMASLEYLSEDGKIKKQDIQSVESMKTEIKNAQLLAA